MPDRLPFKEIAETVDVEAVAQMLGIRLRNNRARCPACETSDDRSLELLPESNSFRCYAADHAPDKKVLAGDVIALYAHAQGYSGMYRAAKELWEKFGAARQTAPATTPQKEKGRDNGPAHPKSQAPFDAEAFLAKLTFTEEVEALGLDEETAKQLGVGEHRGRVYSALRYPSGSIACFQYVDDGKIVLPRHLLPDVSDKVVAFKKRA